MLPRRADGPSTNGQTAKILKKVGDAFMVCKEVSCGPRRFKLTFGTQELRVNYRIHVNTICIRELSVTHIVDEATHFCSTSIFRNHPKKGIWKTFSRCGVSSTLTYLTTLLWAKDLRTHQRK